MEGQVMTKAKVAKPKPDPKLAVPESCGTCHNWRDEVCKRFPPAKVQGEQFGLHHIMTRATDWCGEWRARV